MGGGKKNSVRRMGIGLQLAIQIICVGFLVVAVNVIGFQYYWRADFSRTQKFALAEQTKQLLGNLPRPVRVTVYFSGQDPSLESALYRDLHNLLREYQFSSQDRIEVEMISPARDLSRALELESEYEIEGGQNVVILDDGERTEVVPVVEMGEFDLSGVAMGEPARLEAFRGEEVLTAALLRMLNPEVRVVYALQGNGEVPIADMVFLAEYLQRQNAVLRPLNLAEAGGIPEDASAVMVAGPAYDLEESEVAALVAYWAADGRLLVTLDPGVATERLSAFVESVGIIPEDNRVLTLVPSPTRPGIYGIFRDVPGIFLAGSVVTKRLEGVNGMFPAATQTLTLDTQRAGREEIQLRPLVGAPEQFWGETQYGDVSAGVQYDDGVDAGQPFAIAATAERGASGDDRVEVASSKMIVVGNREFLRDATVRDAPANLDFALSGFNWMFERSRLTGIAPKLVQQFALSLTPEQVDRIAFYVMVLIPGCAAVWGLVVAWRRRA